MITQELINHRMKQYKSELEKLQSAHDEMVKEFQQKITTNQARFAQISGAIAELTQLQQHELPDKCSSDRESSTSSDRISGSGNSPGDNLGSTVVHRELDFADTAPGKNDPGDHHPHSRDPMGDGSTDR